MCKVSLAIHCSGSGKETRILQLKKVKEQTEGGRIVCDQLVGTALRACEAAGTALWQRGREQPDVRLALRGTAFTQDVRMTAVGEEASGWVAAGCRLSAPPKKYQLPHQSHYIWSLQNHTFR